MIAYFACVLTYVWCVLFICLRILHFRRHKRTLCSDQMFACFVVTKVWWVLFKCLGGLYLCRHKRTLFWLNGACFHLYFCRHKLIVCSVLPFLNALSLKSMLYMRNLCIVLSVDLLKNSSNLPFQYSLAIDKCHYENRQ